MTDDHDALHTARAVLGGRPLNLATDEIFSVLENSRRISSNGGREAQRTLDAMRIGVAVEAVKTATDRRGKFMALLRLARALRPYLRDGLPGWFRFMLAFGSERGESTFRLSLDRRLHSGSAKPRAALNLITQSRRAVGDMLVAGAILTRIEAKAAGGAAMSIEDAIEAAILDGDVSTGEEAARKAFQRFRKHCAKLPGGGDTYRLERYAGPIEKYQGRWVALPVAEIGLPRLPSEKGGRPKT